MRVVIESPSLAQAYALVSLPSNENEEIVFASGESDLGRKLVARSDVGVCAILIRAGDREVRVDLLSRVPDGILARGYKPSSGALERATRPIRSTNDGLVLRLDIRRVGLERRVEEVLRAVRVGAVITYAALARRIGQPDAVLRVANACANSPFARAIPGGRVVRANSVLARFLRSPTI